MINRAVEYDRNLTGSYMKIPISTGYEFDEKIMLRKKISGLLPVERCYSDGIGQYWYNISGKQSVDTYCRMHSIGIEFIERMIISICSQIEILEWNLVEQNCLILDPEQIFISNQNDEIIFAIYPGNSDTISNGFQQLMEYLLTKIDHKDLNAVHMGYALYEKTLDEAYSIVDIRDEIQTKRSKIAKENENEYELKDKSEEILIDKNKACKEITNSIQKKENKSYCQLSMIFEEMGITLKKWKHRINAFKLEKKNFNETVEIVYPEEKYSENKITIHPTICLGEYEIHPEGVLRYEGTEQLLDIKLERESSTIGKDEECEVLIQKDTVSRYHARIEKKDNDFFLEDLNSMNGTYLNEELLPYKEIRQLKSNDIIRFADVQYRFL